MWSTKSVKYREANPSDFSRMIGIIKSSFLPYYPDGYMPGNQSIRLDESPYTWHGDSALDWTICELEGEAIAFSLSRLIGLNYHLHCLYVDSRFHKKGFGMQLLIKHWKQGLKVNPHLDTFSLHVDKENTVARGFYEKFEYREVIQENVNLEQEGGLCDWARNCRSHGDWPLRKNHLLYIIEVKDVMSRLDENHI
ncbi:GNAT family N-acetyltransferase [candidate division WOR-3 bacterium]|nr:GNAT family N-acetyltransferase [candidate division WOR-3 bacterium]